MNAEAAKNKRSWAIILLVFLNLVALAALWLTAIRRPHLLPPAMADRRPPDAQFFLDRELGLSPEQSQAFLKLREAFLKTAAPLRAEIRGLQERYLAEMSSTSADKAKIEALVGEIAAKRAEEEKRLLLHFQSMGELCTPEQKPKFQSVMRRFMTMIGVLDPIPPRGQRGPGFGPRGRPDLGSGRGSAMGPGLPSGQKPGDLPGGRPGERSGRPGDPPPLRRL